MDPVFDRGLLLYAAGLAFALLAALYLGVRSGVLDVPALSPR